MGRLLLWSLSIFFRPSSYRGPYFALHAPYSPAPTIRRTVNTQPRFNLMAMFTLPLLAPPQRCNSMPAFWVGACCTDLHSAQRLAFGLVGQISTLRPCFRRSSYSGRPIQDSLAL